MEEAPGHVEDSDSGPSTADFISMLSQYNEQQRNHQSDRDFFMADVTWDVSTLPSMVIETSHNLTMSLGDNQFLLLSDNGANSCLISRKAFHIDYIDPHRKAVIRGCKDKYVSHGNPIGSGRAVVVPNDPDAEPIGIIVNEAAIHDDDVSLLSEYQARDFGTIVNSVPRRHAREMNLEDAQYISPEADVRIPFRIRQALVTLVVRPPTVEELNSNMPFFELTSADRWDPLAHNDTGPDIDPLDGLQAQLSDSAPDTAPNPTGNPPNEEPVPLPVQNGIRAPALEFDPLDVPEGFLPAIPAPDAAPGPEDQVPAIANNNGNHFVRLPVPNGEEPIAEDTDLLEFFDTY